MSDLTPAAGRASALGSPTHDVLSDPGGASGPQGHPGDSEGLKPRGGGPVTAEITTAEWGIRAEGEDVWSEAVFDRGTRTAVMTAFTEESARKAARNAYLYGTKLIRRVPGGAAEVVEYGPAILPVPTDADLRAEPAAGVMTAFLGEEAEMVVALGHVDPAVMAEAATLRRVRACPSALRKQADIPTLEASDVEHVWAVRREAWGYDADSDWGLFWVRDGIPISPTDPGAFKLTVVADD